MTEKPPISEKDPRWVGCWYIGFLISAGSIGILSILFITFPESVTHIAKKKIEHKKLQKATKKQQLADSISLKSSTNSTITTASTGLSNSDSNFDLLNASKSKRVLHTIDESNEISNNADKNSEYFLNLSTISLPRRAHFALDSISTISNSVSTYTNPSIAQSNQNSTTKILKNHENSKNAYRLKHFFRDKFMNVKLKLQGFLKSFLKLIMNLRYTLIVIIMSLECIIVSIFTHYMILYSQQIYKLPNSRASILVGGIIVPAAIIGA